MLEEEIKSYIKAGEIAAKVLKYVSEKVQVGMTINEVCEIAEKEIKNKNAQLAFPCNISINHIAAHNTADFYEIETIPPKSVVKIDIGVSVNGYIADTATTVSFNPIYDRMVEITKKALNKAIENISVGTSVSYIGKIVEKITKSYGYNPIKNLSGHLLNKNLLHAGKNVPNFDDGSKEIFEKEEVYAIEPFITNGVGYVYDSPIIRIYSFRIKPKKINEKTDKILEEIWKERNYLPFCIRWYKDKVDPFILKSSLEKLSKKGRVINYNVLIEKSKGIVAQEEHTVIILDKEIIITTLRE